MISHAEVSYLKTRVLHVALALTLFCTCAPAHAFDDASTKITWDREISRIMYARCTTCHRSGGSAFSLMGYQDALPWAKAIKSQVLSRTMPPWGAVKGFGEFRNDEALTQEELNLIQSWVNGNAPEGNPNDLPRHLGFKPLPEIEHRPGEIVASGDYKFEKPFELDGFWPTTLPNNASLQITVERPDGSITPLVWLQGYLTQSSHPFLLRTPLALPPGTVIHGLPRGASLILLPVVASASKSDSRHAPDRPTPKKTLRRE